jgi:predicted nucleotide-binding protein
VNLEPIILHEQANQGKTIIEKFEAHAGVGFAIVLLTQGVATSAGRATGALRAISGLPNS